MNEERAKRKLTAILSADVKGYSRLMGEDELGTIETLKKYRKIITSLIDQFKGRVVDSPGDNILSEFGSVVDAVQCAVKIQEELKGENAEYPESRRMEYRIGVNLGDVVEDGERIYGDGVNIAARIEGLADGGGICISISAFDQVKNKISTGYEYLGEHSVKNIKDPVGVYRLIPDAETKGSVVYKRRRDDPRHRRRASLIALIVLAVAIAAFLVWNFYFRGPAIAPASVDRMAYPLPDKPSIAVLPFTNMSGDPEQDYIGDGLSENIISALSVNSKIFVIARNSTFTYKGKPVKVQQVAEDLGVQYVLEGSVQKSGDRLRVTAQLIDAIKGHHLWSEKYDREMQELFNLQDEITKKIVDSMRVELGVQEEVRLLAKSTDNLEAWKHLIKGIELVEKVTNEDNAKAQNHFEAALKLDPEYVDAIVVLALSHRIAAAMRWTDSPIISMKRGFELLQKALKLDDQNPVAHSLLGMFYGSQRQHKKAIIAFQRAITLNPNYAQGHANFGASMFHAGQFEEAAILMEKAYRLNPNLTPINLAVLAKIYVYLGRDEEAIEVCNLLQEHVSRGNISGWVPPLHTSFVYQELGREEEARAYMMEALKINPNLSLEFIKKISIYRNPAHLQRDLDAYRKAGMPENPPLPLPDKPSIAVLPFTNMSGDPEQDYIGDGLSENIISALSISSKLFVIARNSTFTYKGKPVKVQQVARELGVQYVLEGSIQKTGDRLRVTAQLIDALSGHHIWSEKYDREMKEFFDLQDEITKRILASLHAELTEGEAFRVFANATDNLEAFNHYLKGVQLVTKWTEEDMSKAREHFEGATELDPEYVGAWVSLAGTHLMDALQGWSDSPLISINHAFEIAQKALEINDQDPNVHSLLGQVFLFQRQYEKAIISGTRATTLNPNFAYGYSFLARSTLYSGQFEETVTLIKKAWRLDPTIAPISLRSLCLSYIYLGRYEEALEVINKMEEHVQRGDFIPKYFPPLHYSWVYQELGREEEARAFMAEALKINSNLSLEGTKRYPYKNPAHLQRMFDAYRKAGMPEKPSVTAP